MGQFQTFSFDALRQVAVELLAKRGMVADSAAKFVDALLWYDATIAAKSGIASLIPWIMAIDKGDVDPLTEGGLSKEFAGTAVLDGKRGPAPLVLNRAARIAQEKAREVGIGVVRVTNLAGKATPEAAAFEIAIGPMIGCVHGPGPSITVAVPTMGTVPAIFSSELGEADALVPPWSIQRLPVWSIPFASEGDWLVSAYSVPAFQSLESFHEQIDGQLHSKAKVAGEIRAGDWQATRTDQHENGLTISAETAEALRREATKAGLEFPTPSSL